MTKSKKSIKIILIGIILFNAPFSFGQTLPKQQNYSIESIDSLPNILNENHTDLINCRLKCEAAKLFMLQQLPDTKKEWDTYRVNLKKEIIKRTGIVTDHNLPLNINETATIQMNGYSIKNIFFQTRPGIYATANLYIPEGKGKFPGVIVMMGHSILGKLYDKYQSVGHTLALNGYVALCIDPWGAGERSTIHGEFGDHGDENNLGNSLMNIGETLMGLQVSDNKRGVDLLCSLPFVDPEKIGATGSSGGGNQTMWLAAMDERIKAAVPVVSAGTFESYIMGSPCICEVLPGGLTFTEEAGILALVAPRAIKMCNHQQDANSAFYPSEMIRSYKNARSIFEMYEAENNISYQVFDLPHGYKKEDRETMLGWFDLHLKKTGSGSPKNEIQFELLRSEKLMVFSKGERDPRILSTEEFCKLKGNELREDLLSIKSINIENKKKELSKILGVNDKTELKTVHKFPIKNGWYRFALETNDNKLIPVLLRIPTSNSKEFIIISNSEGKRNIPTELIQQIIESGKGVVVVDLSGTGEVASTSRTFDINGNLRTMSRSLLWFEKTVIGEWFKELNIVIDFLHTEFKAEKIQLDGSKEAGLAGLFLGVFEKDIESIVLRNAPASYLFDTSKSLDFFGMGIHLPGFLMWGDISLAAALTGKSIKFIHPVTMSGRDLKDNNLNEYMDEFKTLRMICNQPGKTEFINY